MLFLGLLGSLASSVFRMEFVYNSWGEDRDENRGNGPQDQGGEESPSAEALLRSLLELTGAIGEEAPECVDKANQASRVAEQILLRVKDLMEKLRSAQEDNDRLRGDLEEARKGSLSSAEEAKSASSPAARDDAVLFHIDTAPAEDVPEEDGAAKSKDSEIRYDRSSAQALTEPDPNDKKSRSSSPKPRGPASTCFNCKGDHLISECPQPKDFAAIARNRREFQRTASAALTSSRYHLDEPQRFAHLRPGGMPSDRLRRAMGLRERDLPPYVYRMRALGYPPGWLREAEVRHSGVALYLADGSTLGDIVGETKIKRASPLSPVSFFFRARRRARRWRRKRRSDTTSRSWSTFPASTCRCPRASGMTAAVAAVAAGGLRR